MRRYAYELKDETSRMIFGSHRSFFRRAFGRLRSIATQRIPRAILTRAIPRKTKRMIIFLTPGYDFTAGGVMAIAAMYHETVALGDIHGATVRMCTVPGEPPLFRYTWFENRDHLLALEAVLKRCDSLDFLLLHIPEYEVNKVLDWLSRSPELLRGIRDIQLNVLLFNIDLVQGQNVKGLSRFGRVTCTTAHAAYSNLETREALGVTLHRLLICKGSEFYSPTGYQDKDPLLVVSPDAHPLKEEVLGRIAQASPKLKIQVIQNLSYKDYENLIRHAKWSLTFGEGLDGFFVEPTFSGAVAFAVYNDRFFTPVFAELETVYPSWEVLMDRIASDIERLDEPMAYNRCRQQSYDLLSEHLQTDRFRENLRTFYRGEYTFP